ncbi:hypothetical protein FACUT_13920 [Fusarium acutatum]|uniref:Uncharacterized protein n=1 Tax=Fusarium acutatum TaxID=78861 RepID=A0A8H4NHG3_9HYPO|nr:hypothetical protein FACUT_13920 [Fusarium acutatum]
MSTTKQMAYGNVGPIKDDPTDMQFEILGKGEGSPNLLHKIAAAIIDDVQRWSSSDKFRDACHKLFHTKWIKMSTNYEPNIGFKNVVGHLNAYARLQLSRGCVPKRILGGKTYAWVDMPTVLEFVHPELEPTKTGHWAEKQPQEPSTYLKSYSKK